MCCVSPKTEPIVAGERDAVVAGDALVAFRYGRHRGGRRDSCAMYAWLQSAVEKTKQADGGVLSMLRDQMTFLLRQNARLI